MQPNLLDDSISFLSPKVSKSPISSFPSELQNIREFISQSKIVLNKYQSSNNYLYYRELGSNIFQSIAYIYIEAVLKYATMDYLFRWVENLRSEKSDFFQNPIFISKIPKKSLEQKDVFKKSESWFFETFEKYLDLILTKEKNRNILVYDFFIKCMFFSEMRAFCLILLRKMLSFFVMESPKIAKNYINLEGLKIFDLNSEEFSHSDLLLLSYSTNFRIDLSQAIINSEMKQELFHGHRDKESNGRISLIICNNVYYSFYSISEDLELQTKIKLKYQEKHKECCNGVEDEMRKKVEIIILDSDEEKENIDIKKDSNIRKIEKKQLEEQQIKPDIQKDYLNTFQKDFFEEEKVAEKSSDKKFLYKDFLNFEAIQQPKIINKPNNSSMELENVLNDKSLQNINIELCQLCEKMRHEKPLFLVENCNHKLCFDCLLNEFYLVKEKQNFCPKKNCHQRIWLLEIENYFQDIQILESKSEAIRIEEEQNEKNNENELNYENNHKNNEKLSSIYIIEEEIENKTNKEKITSNEERKNPLANSEKKSQNKKPSLLKSVQINPKIPEKRNQAIEKQKSLEKISGIPEPKILCVSCYKNTPQSLVFSNANCFHCYCHDCVIRKMNSSNSYTSCESKSCLKLVTKTALEKYLVEYNENRENNEESKIIQQVCYVCTKETKIKVGQYTEMEIYQCSFCHKTSCMIHKAPLADCYCFCGGCNIKTEADMLNPTRKICVNCRNKYCILCKGLQSKCKCYCKICDGVINVSEIREDIIMNYTENYCEKCFNNKCYKCWRDVEENKRRRSEKCGHVFCKECMYEEFEKFRKTKCIFKH